MSHGWNNTPSTDDFVIPDDYDNENNQGGSSGRPDIGINFGSTSSWTPKVDLSSAFKPFSTLPTISDNNKVNERQFQGGDTLDEPIWETLRRDISRIGKRLGIVIWPMQLSKLANKQQQKLIEFARSRGIRMSESTLANERITVSDNEEDTTGISNEEVIKQETLDWDLWGPLIFSLTYSVFLGLSGSKNQTNQVFSGSFSFIWIFFLVVGLNIQLLGGTISYMSAISATGYSMFPIVMGEVVCSLILKWRWIRLIVISLLNVWSIYSAMMSLKCSGVIPGRVALALYPVGLMYSILSWLVIIT